ncbi:MAG: hypothetical protein JRC77_10275 [Deltaproteobacteria bacterium]|nr:hypothetical protein [Deltaproteobacteria bacterium]
MAHQPTLVERSGSHPGPLIAVLIVLSLFFFIYSVEFSFFPVHTSRIVSALGGLLLLLITIRVSFRIAVDQRVLLVVALLTGFVGWVGIRTAIAGAEDLSLMIASALIFIQVLPGAAAIAYVLQRRDFEFDELIRLLYLVIVMQAGFIVLSFFSWDFKQWTLMHIPNTAAIDPLHPFRVRGLTHGTGAKLSAFQGAGLVMATYLLIKCRTYRELAYLLATSVVVTASIFLTGRTGVLAIPLAMGLLGAYTIITGRVGRKSMLAVLAIPIMLIVGFLRFQQFYLFLGGWDSTVGRGDALESLIRWFTKEFSFYLSGSPLESGSVGTLLRYHWFLPETDSSLFFGDPNTWNLARVQSDVGLVRMLFGAGLIGTLLLYLGVLAMLVSMLRWAESIEQRALLVFLVIWVAIVELKEPYFLNLRYLSLIAILFFFMCLKHRSRPI